MHPHVGGNTCSRVLSHKSQNMEGVDVYDPHREAYYDDPIKIQVLLRIQREEINELRDEDKALIISDIEKTDEIQLLRNLQGNTEEKVQTAIKERMRLNRKLRKYTKFKKYILEAAPPRSYLDWQSTLEILE